MPRKSGKVSSEVLKSDKRSGGRPPAVTGHGAYDIKSLVPKGTFAKLGGAAGGALGAAAGTAAGGLSVPGGLIGGALGSKAGAYLAKVVGFGDYAVKENTLLGGGFSVPQDVGVPMFVGKKNSTVVRHREFVRDILAPASPLLFTSLVDIDINPGNPQLFPWLSAVASNFQQYRMLGMVIEFRSTTSDITAGGALGAIMLATNYNVDDEPYTSKVDMENSEFAVSAKPSVSQLHAIECAPSDTSLDLKYVIKDAYVGQDNETDLRFYNLGKFQLASVGLPSSAGAVLGELWVSYEVELIKPIRSMPTECGQVTTITATNATMLGSSASFTGGLVIERETSLQGRFLTTGDYLIHARAGGTASATALTCAFPDSTATLVTNSTTGWLYCVRVKPGDRFIPTASQMTTTTAVVYVVWRFPYTWTVS